MFSPSTFTIFADYSLTRKKSCVYREQESKAQKCKTLMQEYQNI